MFPHRRARTLFAFLGAFWAVFSIAGFAASGSLGDATLAGPISPVRDPSIIYSHGTYYVFFTDNRSWKGTLPILCSKDLHSWKNCGSVFEAIPEWLHEVMPQMSEIWAPDVSYFNGLYHVYYSASMMYSQHTVIGLATNVTLNPNDPRYHWVDHGQVLESFTGDEINALDPNVLVDRDHRVWLTYGSYWGGIRQSEIDPQTGMLKGGDAPVYPVAARPDIPFHPIEGSSQLYHDGYYYLFVSIDYCCNQNIARNNYKMAVGRSKNPHGPFLAQDGTPMMQGGSTVILRGDSQWTGVGGGTVYDDPKTGDTRIVFHGQHLAGNGSATLWLKTIRWADGWPMIQDDSTAVTAKLGN